VLENLNRFLKQREPWRGCVLTFPRRRSTSTLTVPQLRLIWSATTRRSPPNRSVTSCLDREPRFESNRSVQIRRRSFDRCSMPSARRPVCRSS
jgi:hypothetical protein